MSASICMLFGHLKIDFKEVATRGALKTVQKIVLKNLCKLGQELLLIRGTLVI